MTDHRVQMVRFPPKANHGELECTCGAVMDSAAFNDHRASEGFKRKSMSDNRGTDGTPNVWRTGYKRLWERQRA